MDKLLSDVPEEMFVTFAKQCAREYLRECVGDATVLDELGHDVLIELKQLFKEVFLNEVFKEVFLNEMTGVGNNGKKTKYFVNWTITQQNTNSF